VFYGESLENLECLNYLVCLSRRSNCDADFYLNIYFLHKCAMPWRNILKKLNGVLRL